MIKKYFQKPVFQKKQVFLFMCLIEAKASYLYKNFFDEACCPVTSFFIEEFHFVFARQCLVWKNNRQAALYGIWYW
jgi:hypothetical protein